MQSTEKLHSFIFYSLQRFLIFLVQYSNRVRWVEKKKKKLKRVSIHTHWLRCDARGIPVPWPECYCYHAEAKQFICWPPIQFCMLAWQCAN